MALTQLVYTYTGTNSFAVNFPLGYLKQSHVTARVNAEVDGQGNPLYRSIIWLTNSTIQIGGTLVNGDTITIERTVPNDILYVTIIHHKHPFSYTFAFRQSKCQKFMKRMLTLLKIQCK